MYPDIRWITAVYSEKEPDGSYRKHVGVKKQGRKPLERMLQGIAGKESVVALYIPEGTPDEYRQSEKHGKVVALAKVIPLERGEVLEDYAYPRQDGRSHWQFAQWELGFPCNIVCTPEFERCPMLRDYGGDFRGYTSVLHHGPLKIPEEMRELMQRDFSSFAPFSMKQ